eukprot:763179-Hanusia_phi.AAC.5
MSTTIMVTSICRQRRGLRSTSRCTRGKSFSRSSAAWRSLHVSSQSRARKCLMLRRAAWSFWGDGVSPSSLRQTFREYDLAAKQVIQEVEARSRA